MVLSNYALFKGIGELASFYVTEFFKAKVHKKNLVDKNGRFHVSQEVMKCS